MAAAMAKKKIVTIDAPMFILGCVTRRQLIICDERSVGCPFGLLGRSRTGRGHSASASFAARSETTSLSKARTRASEVEVVVDGAGGGVIGPMAADWNASVPI